MWLHINLGPPFLAALNHDMLTNKLNSSGRPCLIRVLPASSTTNPDPILLHYPQLGHLPIRQISFLKTKLLLQGGGKWAAWEIMVWRQRRDDDRTTALGKAICMHLERLISFCNSCNREIQHFLSLPLPPPVRVCVCTCTRVCMHPCACMCVVSLCFCFCIHNWERTDGGGFV